MFRLPNKSRKKIILLSTLVFLDQLTKIYFSRILNVGQTIPVIKNIFHLSLVYNSGAAFGVFQGKIFLFIIISVVAIYLIALNIKHKPINYSWILVLSGAVGNLIDRARLGYVIDFLDFRVWPVFNIADSCITIGMIILVFSMFKSQKV